MRTIVDALWLNEIFTYKSFQIPPMVTWAEHCHTIIQLTINTKWKTASKSPRPPPAPTCQGTLCLPAAPTPAQSNTLDLRCLMKTALTEDTTLAATTLANNNDESFVKSLCRGRGTFRTLKTHATSLRYLKQLCNLSKCICLTTSSLPCASLRFCTTKQIIHAVKKNRAYFCIVMLCS